MIDTVAATEHIFVLCYDNLTMSVTWEYIWKSIFTLLESLINLLFNGMTNTFFGHTTHLIRTCHAHTILLTNIHESTFTDIAIFDTLLQLLYFTYLHN